MILLLLLKQKSPVVYVLTFWCKKREYGALFSRFDNLVGAVVDFCVVVLGLKKSPGWIPCRRHLYLVTDTNKHRSCDAGALVSLA